MLLKGVEVVAEHPLLTVREVATSMRVSTMTVYRLIRDGELAAIRVGRTFRIRAHDVDSFLTARTVGARTHGETSWPAG